MCSIFFKSLHPAVQHSYLRLKLQGRVIIDYAGKNVLNFVIEYLCENKKGSKTILACTMYNVHVGPRLSKNYWATILWHCPISCCVLKPCCHVLEPYPGSHLKIELYQYTRFYTAASVHCIQKLIQIIHTTLAEGNLFIQAWWEVHSGMFMLAWLGLMGRQMCR